MIRRRRTSFAWATAVAAGTAAAAAAAAAPPRTCFWDPAATAAVHDPVAGNDPSVAAAVAALRASAATALTAGPFSVMDKSVTPPGGDKHDYTSLGRYYWPDPAKPGGLPWITIDGKPNPDVANGRLGDEPRLVDLWDATRALARWAYLTGDRRCAARAAVLLRTWFVDPTTRMNPNARYAARYPGHWDGRYLGIHSTARPIMDVLDAVELLRQTPDWTTADDRAMVDWCRRYLDWLTDDDMGKQEGVQLNNHAVAYDCLVVRLAMFTRDADLARRVLAAAPLKRIARQIEPDGRQPLELARATPWEYSRYNLEFLFRLAMLGDRAGVDLWHYRSPDGRSIRAALDYVVAHAGGAGPGGVNADVVSKLGVARIGPMLQLAAAVYRDPAYLTAMHRIGWSGELRFQEDGLNGVLGAPPPPPR